MRQIASSPTRPNNLLYERQKLQVYRIHIDQACATLPSVHAEDITHRRRSALDQIECDGIRHIALFLPFTGEAEKPDAWIKQTWFALKEACVV